MKKTPFSVQSYCFRDFADIPKVASLVKDCGLTGIEICSRHADFHDPDGFRSIHRRFQDQGVEVTSIGVNTLTGDRASDRDFFRCAGEIGLGVMSVNLSIDGIPESLSTAESLAKEFDLLLAIHNHGGRHWLGSRESLRWVFERTGPRVGLNLDTAWALHSKEDPTEMVKEFGERLYVIHLKDFVFDRSGSPSDVVVGTGNLDLRKLDANLESAGFSGVSVLEFEGDSANPVPALRQCVGKIRSEMSIYG